MVRGSANIAGTLTQNEMQVVRMWMGGVDHTGLSQLQVPQPGACLPAACLATKSAKLADIARPCMIWCLLCFCADGSMSLANRLCS